MLRRDLFGKQTSIVMTSATLTRKVGRFFQAQVGAEEVQEGIVNSPRLSFQYASANFDGLPRAHVGERTLFEVPG